MKVPISWLKEYVEVTEEPEELAHRLTMAGNEVDSIQWTGDWEGVVVGIARDVRPHPNADRLRLVDVDNGSGETVEVVCGAPNVAAGQKIAFAQVGATLADPRTGEPTKLKRSKIRGVTSNGMVCSEAELGLSGEHDGILVLPEDAPAGTPLSDYLGDVVLDLELTPNRPDCLGVVGVARDVAALTGTRAAPPPEDYPEDGPEITSLTSVDVEDPDLCPRYTATLIQGVKMGPSPEWLADRIRAIGERPINNVVDITNYVMFELGQPLHAFDHGKLAGGRVIVRRARSGERLLTLDEVERKLDEDNLVIADAEKPIGLGGIIGGTTSGITEETTDVLLEAANFDPANNRRTAARMGIKTEATLRFEKGLRPELAEHGLRRATRLIQEIAGGSVAKGIIDVWPGRARAIEPVSLPREKIGRVLGVEYPDETIKHTLESLGCAVDATEPGFNITPPYWRPDITIPEDVLEELARVIGYETIPTTGLSGAVPQWAPTPERDLRERVRDTLAGLGMQETISYSLNTRETEARSRRPDPEAAPLRLMNPISSELEALRTSLRPGLLGVLSRNARSWRGPLALFEVGRVFLDRGEGVGLPEEREIAAGVFAGPRRDLHWGEPQGRMDFYDARGMVEALLERLNVTPEFSPTDDGTFQPGRCAAVTVPSAGGVLIGVVGEVSEDVREAFDIDVSPVAMFELNVDALCRVPGARIAEGVDYEPFSRYPESIRDLALLLDASVQAADVLAIARKNRLVKSATVFDVYQGEGIPSGKKSMAVRVVYQSDARTLTHDEVSKAEQGILHALGRQLSAELRT